MSINPWDTTTPTLFESNVARRTPLQRVEEPEFFADTLPAALGYQYMPMFNAVKNAVKHGTEVQQGYNALNDVDGYEEYKHHLMNAVSEDHMIDLKFQLDENKRRRQVLADSSFWANLGAGVFDPINLVALPFGGVAATAGRQFLRTGAGVGLTQAGLEVARAPFDPLATKEEIAMNIGSAFVIGGAIGTLTTIPARRRAAAIKKTEEDITQFVNELDEIDPQFMDQLNNRELREFGDFGDADLSRLRTTLPKELFALEEKLATATKKFERLKRTIDKKQKRKEQISDIEVKKLEALTDETFALRIAVSDKNKQIKQVKDEERIRRIQGIKGYSEDLTKPFDFADNFFTDSFFFKGVSTGFKRVLQNKKVSQTVKSMMVKLAGDAGMLHKMNEMGFATPKSVYQYAATRNGEWAKVYMDMLEQYGEHTKKGYTQLGDVVISNIDGSFSAYLKEVNRKYINGEEATTTAEKESIQALKNFYKTWEDRLVEVGILGNIDNIKSRILSTELKIKKADSDLLDAQIKIIKAFIDDDAIEPSIKRMVEGDFDKREIFENVKNYVASGEKLPKGASAFDLDKVTRLNTRLTALEDQLYELEFSLLVAQEQRLVPQNEEDMFPRYWNRDEIRARRGEFANILREHFKENPYIYERNEAAFEQRRIRNLSELSDVELEIRLGEEFGINQIMTQLQQIRKGDSEIGQGNGILGMHITYYGQKGDPFRRVLLDRDGIYKYYKELSEDMKNPTEAINNLEKRFAKNTEAYAHRMIVYRNWDLFKTFNDFQDFVLMHELHHTNINKRTENVKTRADHLRMENKTDRAAIEYLRRELPIIREGQPTYIRRELDVTDGPMLDKRVEDTIDNILGLSDVANDMNAFYGAGKSKHMRHRSLDIPNAKVFDFIQNDPLAVMKAYTSRVAPQYEFAKAFGGKTVDEVLDDIDMDMARTGASNDEINAVRKDFLHLYDRIVGTVLREPHSWDQRTATVLRDFAQTNYLGAAGFSTLPDFAKIMMEHELKDVFKVLFASLGDSRVRKSSLEGKLAGEILEIIQGDAHMRLIDDVTNNPFNEGTYDKFMGKLKWGFYQANLLAPLTNIMKKLDAVVRGHSLIQMSVRLAGGDKKPTKFEIEYLARYGIDKAKAKQIRELVDQGVIEQTDGGLYLPNTENWPKQYDDLKLEFRSSLNSGIMNTILMGTPADKPNIVDGVVYVPYRIARMFGMKEDPKFRGYSRIENGLLGLPFQFYSYTLAAINKITASYATGQARNRAVALAASMGLAYMGLELKNPDFVMDKMSIEDKIARSFDMSGIAALYSDMFYTAMHTSMALGGPDISMGLLQPKFPQKENVADAVVGLAGAGPSIGLDVGRGLKEFIDGNHGEGAKQIMRSMPLARLWIWKDFMNEASNAFTAKRY